MEDWTLEQILLDDDWAEAFGDRSSGNTTKDVSAYGVSDEPFGRDDIDDVLAARVENPGGSETSVAGLFVLKDGRYAAIEASCDYAGWDCQASNTMTVAGSMIDCVVYGLTWSGRGLIPEACRSILAGPFDESKDGWQKVAAGWWEENGNEGAAELLRKEYANAA